MQSFLGCIRWKKKGTGKDRMPFMHAQAHKVESDKGMALEMSYEVEDVQYVGGGKPNTNLPTTTLLT